MSTSSQITYERDGEQLRVRVGGTIVGRIKPVRVGNHIRGYRYHPLSSHLHGKLYATVDGVKRSLESDDEE